MSYKLGKPRRYNNRMALEGAVQRFQEKTRTLFREVRELEMRASLCRVLLTTCGVEVDLIRKIYARVEVDLAARERRRRWNPTRSKSSSRAKASPS